MRFWLTRDSTAVTPAALVGRNASMVFIQFGIGADDREPAIQLATSGGRFARACGAEHQDEAMIGTGPSDTPTPAAKGPVRSPPSFAPRT
jgi:hypothetical protein